MRLGQIGLLGIKGIFRIGFLIPGGFNYFYLFRTYTLYFFASRRQSERVRAREDASDGPVPGR